MLISDIKELGRFRVPFFFFFYLRGKIKERSNYRRKVESQNIKNLEPFACSQAS